MDATPAQQGVHLCPCKPCMNHREPTELTIYRSARGEADAARLWDLSLRLAGVEFSPV